MADNTDDLIISISTDQATLRRSIKRIEQDLSGLAGSVQRQFATVGKSIDDSVTSSMQNRINAMVGIGTKAANEWSGALADQGKELERLRARYSPLFNTINSYKAAVTDIRRAHSIGAISANEMAAAISKERQAALASTAAIKGRNAALAETPMQRGGRTAGGGGLQTANIAAQFQDIAVTSAMGMSPLQIALQQGTQLSSVIGTMESPVKGLAAAFMSVVSPVSLVTIGVVAAGAALIQYLTSADDIKSTDTLLKEHAALISRIKGAYGEAADGLDEYKKESRTIVQQDTVDKIKEYRAAILGVAKDVREGLKLDPADFGSATFTISEVVGAVNMLDAGIKSGQPDLQGFVERLIAIENQKGTPANIKEILQSIRETAKSGVDAQRALNPLVGIVNGVGAAAAEQAKKVSAFAKALSDLSDIAKPALSDAEQAEAAFKKAMGSAIGSEDRAAAVRQYDAARARIDNQNPTVINSDGNTTSVPVPGQKPVTLGDKPDKESKKAETAAQKARNAYRDLMKSADDRIGQLQQEIDLTGKFGAEAEAARFKLDLLQASENKGRSISEDQLAELEKKVELYRQYSDMLARTKLAQDLLEERRFNTLSAQDQKITTTLKQYGRPTDLNSQEAKDIRNSLNATDLADGIKSFGMEFSGGLITQGKDLGEAFGDAVKNAAQDQMQKSLDSLFSQIGNALAQSIFGGPSAVPGVTSVAAPIASVAGSVFGKAPVGAVTRSALPDVASSTGIAAYIAKGAAARGIDPNIALKVAKSEGGLSSWNLQSKFVKNGVQEPSFGPFQLYKGGGLGNDFMKKTGLDPALAQNGPAGVDFALDHAAKNGWGAWYGAKNTGIGKFEGIGVGGSSSAAEAVNKLAESAGAATKGLDTMGGAVGKLGQNLATSAFPSAPSAPTGGGGMGWLGSLFGGGGLSSADIAKYTPMVGLFADGGDVTGPGSGTSDSIPTMLSNGEFVVKASQSKKHRALLHAINSGTLGRMAGGGLVGGRSVPVPVAPALASRRTGANDNYQPGVLQVQIMGANGDEHVKALVQQGVSDGLGKYNKDQERGGFGTTQGQFSKRKG
ncbi:MAG: tail length tape measure protein [Alphaproteobacteria bacterium]|nr:MAG: tail length tape measure protein [Alphaproteobacteria bacterium]